MISASAGRPLAINVSDVIAGLVGVANNLGLPRKVFILVTATQVESGDLNLLNKQVGYPLLGYPLGRSR